jgi:hypothetical protein
MALFKTDDIERKVDTRIGRVLNEIKGMHDDTVMGTNDLQRSLDLLLDEQRRTNELLMQLLNK